MVSNSSGQVDAVGRDIIARLGTDREMRDNLCNRLEGRDRRERRRRKQQIVLFITPW